ncbi:MAG: DNA translocase FtsK 4TM domain-containing protein, partial [Opitutales bacterium]
MGGRIFLFFRRAAHGRPGLCIPIHLPGMFGRKKQTEIKSRNTSKTAFAPRRSPMRPFWALGCFALAVLTVLAYVSYRPLQPVFFPKWLGNTAGSAPVPGPGNWVGTFGATLTAFTSWLTGYAGLFFLPIYLFCLGYWLGFRRAHVLRTWRVLLMVLTLIALAGLATWLETMAPHLSMHSDYFPHGDGGLIGYILYDKLMHDALGPAGSAVVLGLVYVVGLIFIFVEEPGQTLEGLWHAFAQWRLKKAEAARLKREETQKAKAAALLESKQAGPAVIPQMPPAGTAPRQPGKGAPEAEAPRGHGTFKLGDSDAMIREAPREEAVAPVLPAKPTPPPPARPAPKPVAPEEPVRGKTRAEEKASALGSLRIIEEEKVEKGSVSLPQKKGDYVFPGLDLLAPGEVRQTDSAEFHQERAAQIVRTLADFGVQVRAEEIHTGPVITRYEV